jgi:hypothetical protein
MSNQTQETLDAMKAAQLNANADILEKNFSQPGTATTGLQAYDLEAPSKKLVPLMTPLRNMIPRRGGGFSIQANWKAITGINSGNTRAGVSEGKRGGTVSHTLKEYLAAYRGIGLEKTTTFEADLAARGFEDVKALAVLQALQSLMIAEEGIILGGNTSLALGTTPTPTVTNSASGGTIAAATYSVICVALGLQAYWDMAGWNNGNTNQSFDPTTATVPASVTRTNVDGTTDTFGGGSAQKSTNATTTTSGSTSVINASVAAVRGAYAYAWFVGAAGAERLAALTTINSVVLTSIPGSGQLASALPSSDNSTSALEFDGLLTIAATSTSGAYFNALATGTPGTGTTLTGAGGRIVEIDAALATFYQQYRMQPTHIYVNFKQFQKITNVILGQTNPAVYFTSTVEATAAFTAGRNVGTYLSPIDGSVINIVVHPNLVPGTILFYTAAAPAYVDGISDICRVRTRQEYYQIAWPIRTRKYEYGVYADEVLQHFFPPSLGILTNVA